MVYVHITIPTEKHLILYEHGILRETLQVSPLLLRAYMTCRGAMEGHVTSFKKNPYQLRFAAEIHFTRNKEERCFELITMHMNYFKMSN